jgi:chromosome segregation ATPase
MDPSAQRSFQSKVYSELKARLDALHYTQPLGKESAALVEHLLDDLLKTTEGFQQLKRRVQESQANLQQQIQTALEPLQTDNARLLLEKNALTLELVRTKEACDAQVHSLFEKVGRLDRENSETPLSAIQSSAQLHESPSAAKASSRRVAGFEDDTDFRLQSKALSSRESADARLSEVLKQARLKIEDLECSVSSLSLELRHCKGTNSVHLAHQSDRRAHSGAIERLEHERSVASQQLFEEAALKEHLERDLRSTREELRLTQTQLNSLRRQVEANQQTMSRVSKEHSSSAEESYGSRQVISGLEGRNALLDSQLANFKYDLEREAKLKTASELLLDSTRSELSRVQTELQLVGDDRLKLQGLCEDARRELETYKEEIRSLTRYRETDRRTVDDMERRVKQLTTQLQAAGEDMNGAQRELFSVSEELRAKLEELRRGETMRLTLEKELTELRPLRVRWQDSLSELRRLQETSIEKDQENTRRRQELEECRHDLRSSSTEAEGLQAQLLTVRGERDRLEGNVEELKTRQVTEAATHSRRLNNAENEIGLLKQQIETSRESQRSTENDLEKALDQLAKLEDRLLITNEQLNRTDQQRQSGQAEVDRLKEELKSCYGRESEAKNTTLRLEDRAYQASLQTDEVRRLLSLEQAQRARLEDDVVAGRRSVESERLASKRLADQSSQLKGLVEALEEERGCLRSKLQAAQQDLTLLEDRRAGALSELAQLRKELGRKDNENKELHEALRTTDKDRDYMQSLLDAKIDQTQGLQGTLSAQARELTELREALVSYRAKDDSNIARIGTQEQEIRRMADLIKQLERQTEDTRRSASGGSREIQRLQESLHSATKENQQVNEQLIKLTQECEAFRQISEELSRSERAAQQLVRASERVKEELLMTYRKACEEKERLSPSFSSATVEQRDAQSRLHSYEQELLSAQRQLQRQEDLVRDYVAEVTTLQRQISTLTSQAEGAERRVQEAYRARDEALREVSSARQFTMGMESNKEEVHRQLTVLEDEKLALETKLRNVQNEALSMREQLNLKRKEFVNLEEVLARDHEAISRLQAELNLKDEEVALLRRKGHRDPSEDLHSSLQELQQKYKETREELWTTKMEEMHNREELNIARLKLQRLEGSA